MPEYLQIMDWRMILKDEISFVLVILECLTSIPKLKYSSSDAECWDMKFLRLTLKNENV